MATAIAVELSDCDDRLRSIRNRQSQARRFTDLPNLTPAVLKPRLAAETGAAALKTAERGDGPGAEENRRVPNPGRPDHGRRPPGRVGRAPTHGRAGGSRARTSEPGHG